MAKVGYSIFGRPDGQVNIANGLFKEAKLAGQMYLEGLTDGINLNKGESVGVIRQVTDFAGKHSGITIVSTFEYAESYGASNRPGGFVGSGVCFKDFPHPTMIQKGLFSLQGAANNLVDAQTRKFLHADTTTWGIKLPEPNDNWSLSMEGISQSTQKKKARLVVVLDAPIKDQILAVVQGVLSNAVYNSFETVLVVQKGDFLDRTKAKAYKTISFFELLNYQPVHSALNQKVNESKAKALEEYKVLSRNIDAAKKDLKKVKEEQKTIERSIHDLDIKNDKKIEKLKEIEKRQRDDEHRAREAADRLTEIKSELTRAEHDIQKGFDSFLNKNQSFSREFKRRVQVYQTEKKEEIEQKYSGKIIVENDDWRAYSVKSKFILIFSIFMFLFGFVVAYLFFGSSSEAVDPNTNPIIAGSPAEVPVQKDSVKINLADIQFITSNKEQLLFISNSLSDSVETSLEKRAVEINDLLQEETNILNYEDLIKIQDFRDSCYFLLPISAYSISTETHQFGTSVRAKILEQYLRMDGNVYKVLGFNADTPVDNDSPIMKHFIWMIELLSEHALEANKNLETTNLTEHLIPLIKPE